MAKKSNVASLYFSDGIRPETVEPLVAKCHDLSSRVETIHLAMNTGGGSIDAGLYAYNMLSSLPCKLITYNVYAVNSVGVALFCAGDERYANPNASFLFHNIRCVEIKGQTADQLEVLVASLRLSAKKVADIISSSTMLSHEEVISRLHSDIPMSATDALSCELINEIRMFLPPTPAIRIPIQP